MSKSLSFVADTAIIGAGVAGMSAAAFLIQHGQKVAVFEKGRGIGGRASRRRSDSFQFDHGAQYFTVHHPLFAEQVERLRQIGVVAKWDGEVVTINGNNWLETPPHERFVGVPGMSSVSKHLGHGADVHTAHRLESARRCEGGWMLSFESGTSSGPYGNLLVTAPAPQTAELLANACPQLATHAGTVSLQPCWATLLSFAERLPVDFDAAFVEDSSSIRWIARNASKPGRSSSPETWVIHADSTWTIENIEQSPQWITASLIRSFGKLLEIYDQPTWRAAHRWRFALVDRPLGTACLFDEDLRVGAAGDWCLGPRLEAAFCSGVAAAARILGITDHAFDKLRSC